MLLHVCGAALAMVAAAPPSATYDAVVIGSGLGGLSAGALLARYGKSVLVCEAHSIAGGCAHSFKGAGGYTFDSGPSLWSGCAAPSLNPMRQVLDAVGESPDWVQYDGWCMYTEGGDFFARAGDEAAWKRTMAELGDGESTVAQWDKLVDFIEPLQRAVLAVPPLALRADLGALQTALPYLPAMADPRIGLRAYLLSGPWSAVLDAAGITDPFLLNWFDFLAFAFSGLPSDGTVAAAMIYMLHDLHKDGARMDYPIGGSGAVVDALVRGLERHGGELRLRTAVSEILLDESQNGRCVGVKLANGETVHAREAVVSNAPIWETARLLPTAAQKAVRDASPSLLSSAKPLDASTPKTPSFMHLHLGIRGEGLSDEALRSIHHMCVYSWLARSFRTRHLGAAGPALGFLEGPEAHPLLMKGSPEWSPSTGRLRLIWPSCLTIWLLISCPPPNLTPHLLPASQFGSSSLAHFSLEQIDPAVGAPHRASVGRLRVGAVAARLVAGAGW